MRLFVTRNFARWMRRSGVATRMLATAALEVRHGLIDAELGSSLVKNRVGLRADGKRGGARVLVATDRETRCFFLYGFNKSERGNVDHLELKALRAIAKHFLSLDSAELRTALRAGVLEEIKHEAEPH